MFRLVFQLNRWMLLLAAYSSSSVSKEEISSLDTSLLPAAGSRVASSFTFGHYSCLLGFLEFTSRFCSKTWRWFIHSYRHNLEMFELNSALKIDLRHHRFTASFWETKINIQHFRFLLLQKEAKKKILKFQLSIVEEYFVTVLNTSEHLTWSRTCFEIFLPDAWSSQVFQETCKLPFWLE